MELDHIVEREDLVVENNYYDEEVSFNRRAHSITSRIEQFKKKHGCKYDYSLLNNPVGTSYCEIGCPTHGVFTQRVDNHARGDGCPKCAGKAHDVVYVWYVMGTNVFKVGVTTATNKLRRINQVAKAQGAEPWLLVYYQCEEAIQIEKRLHQRLAPYSYFIPAGEGRTEFYELRMDKLTTILEECGVPTV